MSRGLAARLGWQRLDSGALYRILALSAVDAGIALSDTDAVAALAGGLDIRFTGDHEDNEAIWVNGRDIKSAVRAEAPAAWLRRSRPRRRCGRRCCSARRISASHRA